MSNKKQLQENNITLEEISQSIKNLPISNSWGGSQLITPSTKDVEIPAFTDTLLTVKGDENLLAENIKKGIELFDIVGTLDSVTGINFGTISISTNKKSIAIQHGLNSIPKFGVLVPYNVDIETYETVYWIGGYGYQQAFPSLYNSAWNCTLSGAWLVQNAWAGGSQERGSSTANNSTITFTCGKSYSYNKGTYYWFVVK